MQFDVSVEGIYVVQQFFRCASISLFHPQMALTVSDCKLCLSLFFPSSKQWDGQVAVCYSGIGYVHIFEGLGGILCGKSPNWIFVAGRYTDRGLVGGSTSHRPACQTWKHILLGESQLK